MNIYLKTYAIGAIVGAVVVVTAQLILAYFNNWQIMVYFNDYNEGLIELFFALTSFPLIIWFLIEEVRKWK